MKALRKKGLFILSGWVDECADTGNYYVSTYLSGTIGAVIGGFVGAIPWILAGVFMEITAAILGLVIGRAALFMYKKFRGKMGPATPWIIGIVTVLSTLAAEVGTWAVIFAREGIPVSFETMSFLLTLPEVAPSVVKDLGIGLLLGLLGVSSLFRKISGDIEKPQRVRA